MEFQSYKVAVKNRIRLGFILYAIKLNNVKTEYPLIVFKSRKVYSQMHIVLYALTSTISLEEIKLR